MYSEPFEFTISTELPDSERMGLLTEMFLRTEAKNIKNITNIKNESYGGYKIYNTGTVKFLSYSPDLTSSVVGWLKEKEADGKLVVSKPTFATRQHA